MGYYFFSIMYIQNIGTNQWRIHRGNRPPPRVVSEEFFLVISFPNLPIPGSHKFFPNYKFITPGLFFRLLEGSIFKPRLGSDIIS